MSLTPKTKKRPSAIAAHQKRYGQHRKTTKRFTSTYWPYLPLLLIVLAGSIINISWNTGRHLLGYATSMSSGALLQYTNNERTSKGLGALALNSQLQAAAQAKANDMATRDYWAHVTPDGQQPWAFISQAGYRYDAAGENLAYGFYTSSDTVAGWMNSPDHRANILNGTYQEVGFGIANAASYQGNGEQTIVVAMYAKPLVVAAPAPRTEAAAPSPKRQVTAAKPAAAAPVAKPAAEPAPTPEAALPAEPASKPAENRTTAAPKPAATATNEAPRELSSKDIARIDILTNGNAEWASLAVSSLMTIAIAGFLIRHGRLWRRYFLKGEVFILHHRMLDIALVGTVVLGFILTRTTGIIQ